MNIIIITSEPPYPCNSGGRIYTWERIKILKEKKNNIYIYSIDDFEKDEKHILEFCESIKFYKRNKSILKNILNIHKPYTAYSRLSKNMKSDIENDINNYNIDLIILDMPQLFLNLPKNVNVPIILTQHNIEYKTFFNISKSSKNIFKKIAFLFEGIKFKHFENSIYKKNYINTCTFISEKDKVFFEKNNYKIKCELIPLGYNFNEKNIKKLKKNRIVFTGKMDYQPNIDAVIWFVNNVFTLIEKEINEVEFYIVGKNPTRDVLKLAKKNVIVTGMVDDVNKYIDESALIVIPLLSGGGVKIKLLEALGRGNIVVTTKKGTEGTKFQNKKHVLIENNSELFANKCIDVLKNRENYVDLVKNSKKIIEEEYSWNSIAEKYNNILNNLVKDRNE